MIDAGTRLAAALSSSYRLERELGAGGMATVYLAVTAVGCDPTFILLHSEPRFIAVVKRMGQGLCTSSARWPIPARPGKP